MSISQLSFLSRIPEIGTSRGRKYLIRDGENYRLSPKRTRSQLTLAQVVAEAERVFLAIQADKSLRSVERIKRYDQLAAGIALLRDRIEGKGSCRLINMMKRVLRIVLEFFGKRTAISSLRNLEALDEGLAANQLIVLHKLNNNAPVEAEKKNSTLARALNIPPSKLKRLSKDTSDYNYLREFGTRLFDMVENGVEFKKTFLRDYVLITALEGIDQEVIRKKMALRGAIINDEMWKLYGEGTMDLPLVTLWHTFLQNQIKEGKGSNSLKMLHQNAKLSLPQQIDFFCLARMENVTSALFGPRGGLKTCDKWKEKRYVRQDFKFPNLKRVLHFKTIALRDALTALPVGNRIDIPIGTTSHAVALSFERTANGFIPVRTNTAFRNSHEKKSVTKLFYPEQPKHRAIHIALMDELHTIQTTKKGAGKEIDNVLKKYWGAPVKSEKHAPQHKGSCVTKSYLQAVLPTGKERWAIKYAFFQFILDQFEAQKLEPADKELVKFGREELQKRIQKRKAKELS
jgi:hypothetical protein